MADPARSPHWLYYKIYVGHVADGLEYLITQTLPALVTRSDVEQWFFLRYVDEGGPHLRLRLKARHAPSPLRTAVDHAIDEALAMLPRLPLPFYRPAILPSRRCRRSAADGVIRAVEAESRA